jgi:hypothetical protein
MRMVVDCKQSNYPYSESLDRADRNAWLRILTRVWEGREIDPGAGPVIPSKSDRDFRSRKIEYYRDVSLYAEVKVEVSLRDPYITEEWTRDHEGRRKARAERGEWRWRASPC